MLVVAGKPMGAFKHMIADGLKTTKCYHRSPC